MKKEHVCLLILFSMINLTNFWNEKVLEVCSYSSYHCEEPVKSISIVYLKREIVERK